MKLFRILIKYSFYCILLGVIFGFNSYAFKIPIPVYITGSITLFILWGLIYTELKLSEGNYSFNQLLTVAVGIGISNVGILYFNPASFGLTHSNSLVPALLLLVSTLIIIWCVFSVSKSIILSKPIDDDYDS